MSQNLGELLRRSAEAVPEPRVDVGELVARAGRRQRRRRLGVAAVAAVAVGAVVVGSIAFRSNPTDEPEPAPSPAPSPRAVSPSIRPGRVRSCTPPARPCTSATRPSTPVATWFRRRTDDGVVFMTGCPWPRPACTDDTDGEWFSDTLWFNDGSTTKAIGRAPTEHIGTFEVYTANPGSLVVWADATSRTKNWITRYVVYDTSRQEVVGRIPYTGIYNTVLHVDEGQVFFNPDSETPGCWVIDVQSCSDTATAALRPGVREDATISAAAFEAELRTDPASAVGRGAGRHRDAVHRSGHGAVQPGGSRLEPVDSNGDPTAFMMTTGGPVALRLPAGYPVPGEEMPLVQWLDDQLWSCSPTKAEATSQPGWGTSWSAGFRTAGAASRSPPRRSLIVRPADAS